MLNNLKIGVRLGIGFAITLVLLIVIAVIGVNRIASLNAEVDDLAKVTRVTADAVRRPGKDAVVLIVLDLLDDLVEYRPLACVLG